MLKTLSLGFAALAICAGAVAPTAASAQSRYDRGYYSQYDGRDYRGSYDREYYGRDGYYDRGGYRHDYRYHRGYRRCSNGVGGTIVGAIAGGLLGNAIAGYHDRGAGTLLGAGAGALAGNAIDRSGNPEYCRR